MVIKRWVCGLLMLSVLVLMTGCGGPEDKIHMPKAGQTGPVPKQPDGMDEPD